MGEGERENNGKNLTNSFKISSMAGSAGFFGKFRKIRGKTWEKMRNIHRITKEKSIDFYENIGTKPAKIFRRGPGNPGKIVQSAKVCFG